MLENYNLATAEAWRPRARAGYERLAWVTAQEPLRKMVELAELKGNETVIDAATGSGAILDTLAPHLNRGGRIIGFDISQEMMDRRSKKLPENAELRVANIYTTGFDDKFAHLITARQVFHNLPDIPGAVNELSRVLKPEGKLIICEYTPISPQVQEFEREIFDIKEPGRHLWTGNQLAKEVADTFLTGNKLGEVDLQYAVMPQYSVRDWMKSSGLPKPKQDRILEIYLNAPDRIKKNMNANIIRDDILVDRPFAFVSAKK